MALLKDPSLLLETTQVLQCGELVMNDDELTTNEEEANLPIDFLCTLSADIMSEATAYYKLRHPLFNNQGPPLVDKLTLRFGCRRPSFDSVLNEGEPTVTEFDDSAVDPNLFDTGYTLAGSTGFCVWAGARFLLEVLLSESVFPEQMAGMRVLELGAGVGLLGTAVAALGGEVLLTDLPTLVDYAITPNLHRNTSVETTAAVQSKWLKCVVEDDDSVHRIGLGWASARPLDWTKPLTEQLSVEALQEIDMVVAADCTWLASLLCHFLNTLNELFQHGTSKCLLSFRRRERNVGSALFTTTDALIEEIQEKRGWHVRLLAWRPLSNGKSSDVCLIEISP